MKIITGNKLKLSLQGTKKLKWGVAGCGRYLEESFLPALGLLKRSKLVAVYGSDIKRAKSISEKFSAQKAFDDYDQFLQSDFDIVYISSRNADHREQVIKAANAGKHILCEKPLGLSSKEVEEMIDVCESRGVLLTINYKFRYHPQIKKAKEFIESDFLGKIVSINAAFNINLPPSDNFRFNKELSGGGALRDLGTHVLDVLRYLGGEITEVQGYLDNVIYKSDVEDFAGGVVKFKNSGYGLFNVSYNSAKSFNRVEITGHKGSLGIDELFGNRHGISKLTINFPGEAKKSFRKRVNSQLFLLRALQRYFIKNEPLLVSGKDGLLNMQIIENLENKSGQI